MSAFHGCYITILSHGTGCLAIAVESGEAYTTTPSDAARQRRIYRVDPSTRRPICRAFRADQPIQDPNFFVPVTSMNGLYYAIMAVPVRDTATMNTEWIASVLVTLHTDKRMVAGNPEFRV